jgi:acetyl esterase
MLAAGGKARWVNETGLLHGFLRARTMSTVARQAFTRICEAAKDLAQS